MSQDDIRNDTGKRRLGERIITRLLRSNIPPPLSDILFEPIYSEVEYQAFLSRNDELLADYARYEQSLFAAYNRTPFILKGFCKRCRKKRRFFVDGRLLCRRGASLVPNLRESLACQCGLTSRGRGIYHFLQRELQPELHPRIYISERVTYLFQSLQQVYAHLEGAEYLHATGLKEFR